MQNKMFLTFLLMLCINITHAQNLLCSGLEDPTCMAVVSFSADNVQQIRSYRGADAPLVLEANWATIESIIMLDIKPSLDDEGVKVKGLQYWRVEKIDEHESFTYVAEIAKDKSFNQLAVRSNMISVGTTNGKIMFWDLI